MSRSTSAVAGAALRGVYVVAGAVAGLVTAARSTAAGGEARLRLRERRGLWDGHAAGAQPWIWIHGASLGEARIAVAVARELVRRMPALRIVVSSMTATGKAQASQEAGVESRYFPVDFAPFVKRVLMPAPPRLFVAVETEIWPETLRLLERRAVPVAFVNARLSARTMPRYLRVRSLLGPLLARVAKVCARDAESAERWRLLGAAPAAIEIAGNIKFDLALPPDRSAAPLYARIAGSPLLLAASTHDGEEALAVEAFVRTRGRFPDARLLLAPRHPERAAAAAEAARAHGLAVLAWSEAPRWSAGTDVVVLDRLGLLQEAYTAADAAFVGGSARPGPGGHNLLEAAVAGCAVAAGPHLENVEDQAVVLAETNALRIVRDVNELCTFWVEVLERPVKFRSASIAARAAIDSRRGALGRSVAALQRLLTLDSHGGAR